MQQHRMINMSGLMLAAMLGLALVGGAARPAAAAPQAQLGTVAVARALVDAFNKIDLDAARPLVAPGVHFIFDAGTSFAQDFTLEQFFAQAKGTHVTETDLKVLAPDTVYQTVRLTGSAIPPLPHPFLQAATIKVVNGQIVSFVGVTLDQTRQDLAALPAPGMPTAGAPDLGGLALLLGTGLLCLLGGVRLRRAQPAAD